VVAPPERAIQRFPKRGLGSSGWSSCCCVEVLSTTLLDGTALDVLSPLEDALASAEVDVSGREVVQALVIAAMIVVLEEVGDSPFENRGGSSSRAGFGFSARGASRCRSVRLARGPGYEAYARKALPFHDPGKDRAKVTATSRGESSGSSRARAAPRQARRPPISGAFLLFGPYP
jgi:hypothetical protein